MYLWIGVAIVAEMALKVDGTNSDLHPYLQVLFSVNVARIAFQTKRLLAQLWQFAELVSPANLIEH
jgi:LysR family cys regulon transcriptional activator